MKKHIQNLNKCAHLPIVFGLVSLATSNAAIISVNFHVGDDGDNQAAHELDGTEEAGIARTRTSSWNNVNVGAGGNNTAAAQIFAPASLTDDTGGAAGTLTSTLTAGAGSTWFGGYGGSSAGGENELTNGISDDGLFNSYLALNGPSGDGSPQDNFVLTISGLPSDYTSNGYNIIIYSETDRGGAGVNSTAARTSFFTISAGGSTSTILTEDDNVTGPGTTRTFDGNYVQSDGNGAGVNYSNYVESGILTADTFTIEVTASNNGGRGGISGFQIVAVPEPSSLGLLGLGLLGLAVRRRR